MVELACAVQSLGDGTEDLGFDPGPLVHNLVVVVAQDRVAVQPERPIVCDIAAALHSISMEGKAVKLRDETRTNQCVDAVTGDPYLLENVHPCAPQTRGEEGFDARI